MLELSETNLRIKEDLDKIIKGAYDEHLSPEQVQMALELSFLFNHITSNVDTITFEYSGMKVKFDNVERLHIIFYLHLIHLGRSLTKRSVGYQHLEDTIIYNLKSTPEFQNAFLQFKRDYKINQIL